MIAHMAHHFKFYGAGIKLILDLAVMLKTTNIDIQKVFEYLSAVKLEKFGKTVLTVCHNFFGEGYDYAIDTLNVEKYLPDFRKRFSTVESDFPDFRKCLLNGESSFPGFRKPFCTV